MGKVSLSGLRSVLLGFALSVFGAIGLAGGSAQAAPEETGQGSVTAAAAQHWAFRPPVRPALPQSGRPRGSAFHPVDAFIAAKQSERGLVPAPEADRRTLIRRVTLDLIGLPPSPEEVEAFLADVSPDAYARLVDRLLASVHYGERWGRHWLDLARWAESDGYEANEIRGQAWRYRDYVVKAFNEDKPYDRFLQEQLAGDELEPYRDEHLIATGFLAAGRSNNNEEDKLVQLNEPLVDMANATAVVALGLTLSCAQCHDHKFEPLSTRDYYAWHAYFLRGQINNLLLRDPIAWDQWTRTLPPQLETTRRLRQQLTDSARDRWRATHPDDPNGSEEKLKNVLSEDDRRLFEELTKKLRALEKETAERQPHTWGFYSPASSPHLITNIPPRGMYPFPYSPAQLKAAVPRVLKRGDIHWPGQEVMADVPAVLHPRRAPDEKAPASRVELVQWLTSKASPLTVRVWVNYVWQQHFGRGLVATPGDFGLKGARPVLPELLDWLAVELRETGWSTKRLHRLIVTSAAYRRSSGPPAEGVDELFLHWVPRRLEGEAVRDSILAAAGLLDRAVGGPSVPGDRPTHRRSIYLLQRRHALPESLTVFDAPTAYEPCPRRHVSTVALQPLFLLNHHFNVGLAEALAARVRSAAGEQPAGCVEAAFRLALGRPPEPPEQLAAEHFFAQMRSDSASPALVDFCQAILNLNEFVYLP